LQMLIMLASETMFENSGRLGFLATVKVVEQYHRSRLCQSVKKSFQTILRVIYQHPALHAIVSFLLLYNLFALLLVCSAIRVKLLSLSAQWNAPCIHLGLPDTKY
jgi:hypothetical protein